MPQLIAHPRPRPTRRCRGHDGVAATSALHPRRALHRLQSSRPKGRPVEEVVRAIRDEINRRVRGPRRRARPSPRRRRATRVTPHGRAAGNRPFSAATPSPGPGIMRLGHRARDATSTRIPCDSPLSTFQAAADVSLSRPELPRLLRPGSGLRRDPAPQGEALEPSAYEDALVLERGKRAFEFSMGDWRPPSHHGWPRALDQGGNGHLFAGPDVREHHPLNRRPVGIWNVDYGRHT
jgi:hypothetical protein